MHIFGICGGSGSGKGTACALFAEFGIPSIDTDRVYHMMTQGKSPCLDELIGEFGESVLAFDGSLDRKELARIVFSGSADNADKKRRLDILNRITHKHILSRTRELIGEYESLGVGKVIVDAPLLFESGFDKECESIIAVIADREVRIKRIMERDGITEEAANARVASQLSDRELIEKCDYVIHNSGTLDELRKEVERVYKRIENENNFESEI